MADKTGFSVNHNMLVFYFYRLNNISLVYFFDVYHFQMTKQKIYLLPESLDQLSGLNIGFEYIFLVPTDIYYN